MQLSPFELQAVLVTKVPSAVGPGPGDSIMLDYGIP